MVVLVVLVEMLMAAIRGFIRGYILSVVKHVTSWFTRVAPSPPEGAGVPPCGMGVRDLGRRLKTASLEWNAEGAGVQCGW